MLRARDFARVHRAGVRPSCAVRSRNSFNLFNSRLTPVTPRPAIRLFVIFLLYFHFAALGLFLFRSPFGGFRPPPRFNFFWRRYVSRKYAIREILRSARVRRARRELIYLVERARSALGLEPAEHASERTNGGSHFKNTFSPPFAPARGSLHSPVLPSYF